jgi:hypothetical protein
MQRVGPQPYVYKANYAAFNLRWNGNAELKRLNSKIALSIEW